METAARLARDRARVVDIGKTKLDLPWNAYYDKELDVRFSRSYGPGRYDERYELEGIDYPIGYVRWTERRNLECFLDLIARKEIEVETLVSGVFPLENASTVYADLASGSLKAVGVLLEYPAPPADGQPAAAASQHGPGQHRRRRPRGTEQRAAGDRVHRRRQLRLLDAAAAPGPAGEVHLAHVATTRSLSAVNAQRRFGFTTASTSADAVLEDDVLDAIFIVTRHHSHADLVCRALETGKAVFVEKPLALTRDEVDRVVEAIAEHRQRPADGGVQPALRAAAHADEVAVRPAQLELGHALPGQRRAAGRRQLVHATTRWKDRGSSARAVTSSTR